MALSDIVTITITSTSVGVPRAGFGTPLILSNTAAWAERVRSYTQLSGVGADFATDSPEYLSAAALFAQNPHPKTIKIGRAALPATKKYEITPLAVNSQVYAYEVRGEGVTATTVSVTSDATATVAEITGLLTTALNAVVGKNFTAVDGFTKVTVTGNAAGDWFSISPVAPTITGKVEQIHVDPGVATDLAAIKLEDDDWYCLLTHFNSNAAVLAAVAWIETEKKLYCFDLNETDAINTAVGNSDTLDDIKTAARKRSYGSYHALEHEFMASAWAGIMLPKNPDSATWAFKTLSGISPVVLTATNRTNLIARSANFYQTIAGLNVTQMGTIPGTDNYIDIVRGDDWVDDDMSKEIFGTMAGADKIPYTDAGVAMIEKDIRASLDRAVARLIYDSYTVEVPKVADVSTANKSGRILPDMKWSAVRTGAVHNTQSTGVVSL